MSLLSAAAFGGWLMMTEHLKHDGLIPHIVHEWVRHIHRELKDMMSELTPYLLNSPDLLNEPFWTLLGKQLSIKINNS